MWDPDVSVLFALPVRASTEEVSVWLKSASPPEDKPSFNMARREIQLCGRLVFSESIEISRLWPGAVVRSAVVFCA